MATKMNFDNVSKDELKVMIFMAQLMLPKLEDEVEHITATLVLEEIKEELDKRL